jgi:endogenous inhibitor of DNA gyrase (YacG/DUF329 family)
VGTIKSGFSSIRLVINGLDMFKECKHCNARFTDGSRSKTRQFCSNECKNKSWYIANREHAIARSHAYEVQNKDKIKITKRYYMNNRRATDINFRLACNIRARVSRAMVSNFKESSLSEYLGCSIPELKVYLESKFQSGMTWDNYGKWEIDHIYPLAKADLTDKEVFLQVCGYKNLQPLWKLDNKLKKDKYE